MKDSLIVGVFCLVTLLSSCASASVPQRVEFCNFTVSEPFKRGRASFNLVYSIEVDADGKPQAIQKVTDDFVGEALVKGCLSRWVLPNVSSGDKVAVVFRWEHGVGWDHLLLKSRGFELKITLTGDRCPYSAISHAEGRKSRCPPAGGSKNEQQQRDDDGLEHREHP